MAEIAPPQRVSRRPGEQTAVRQPVVPRRHQAVLPAGTHEQQVVATALRAPGAPLPAAALAALGSAYQHDFSRVRVHSGVIAARAAEAVRASAFTVGQDVVWGVGHSPESLAGNKLLSHELTHVVEENRAPRPRHTGAPLVVARQPIDVDIEAVTPKEKADLQQRGVRLPAVSAAAADPRSSHPDYVDRRVEAVGYGIYEGGYLLYCSGLSLPIFAPEAYFSFSPIPRAPADPAVFPSREAAEQAIPIGPLPSGQPLPYTYYQGAGGLVVPTVFSPATTPRTIETALRAKRQLADQVQRELVILALTLGGGMLIRAMARRLAKVHAAETPPRFGPTAARARALARTARESGQEVVVNLGGAGSPHEPPHAINVNNGAVGRRDIPNLVVADGSDIGSLFESGSVDRVVGYNMAPEVINWNRAAPGAYNVLKSGGRFEYRFRGARFNPDPQRCAEALKDAGFAEVQNLENGIVTATKP
ncbi:DUF4157 domain-containing protein [Streptomyces sp. Caat 7-52]|uniref:eCIS core domain-containing protein n=1 Tax=Streptomyces sp. Caat 7-52 TaxID=2949637 RepID=UPI002034A8D9|nr:DUF4157 domain-containing protein [Streptomyces sp. Caat 7-52]